MTGAELRSRLRNGLGRQIVTGALAGALSVTFGTATVGAWELAESVSSLESTVNSMKGREDRQDSRLDRHDRRITWVEREARE